MLRLMVVVLLAILSALPGKRAEACVVPTDEDVRRIAATDQAIEHIQLFDDAVGCRVEAYVFDQMELVRAVQGEHIHCMKNGRRHFLSLGDTAYQSDGSVSFLALSRGDVIDEHACGRFSFPSDYVFFGKGIPQEKALDLLKAAEEIRTRIGSATKESNSLAKVVHGGRLLEVAIGSESFPWSAMFCSDACVVVNFHLAHNADVGEFNLVEVLP